MIFPLLALLQASRAPLAASHVSLYRSAPVYGSALGPLYVDVEDTVLDRDSTLSHGGDYTLEGGDGKTLLIRFGGLAGALGPGVRVVDATLVLTSTGQQLPTLKSIGVVRQSWGEGPFRVLTDPSQSGAESFKVNPNAFAATWRNRIAGRPWEAPGAIGPDVAPIDSAASHAETNKLEISGLGSAVNSMLNDPGSNHGFAISFADASEFFSSESVLGKPTLRLTLERVEQSSVADVLIERITRVGAGFSAFVFNRGTAAESGVVATWFVDGNLVQTDPPVSVGPGQRVVAHFDGSVKESGVDHRVGTVTVRLTPGANDSILRDKELTEFVNGLPILVLVPQRAAATYATLESPRGTGLANWIQSQIDFMNDSVFARSRFSFAPDGCLERVSLSDIRETGPLVDGPEPLGISVGLEAGSGPLPALDFDFMKRVLLAIGAPDLGQTAFPLGSTSIKVPGVNVGAGSPSPGLTGGGDTRFEGGLPRQTLLPETATFDSALTAPGVEPTGMLSATTVGVLNALVSVSRQNRISERAQFMSMPPTILLSTVDEAGRALKNAQLDFFQSHSGEVPAQPAFSLTTGSDGLSILPHRKVAGSSIENVFGTRDLVSDGAYLVRATFEGKTAWSWIHAWQLVDASLRGDAAFANISVPFDLPSGPVEAGIDRAENRAVSDSSGALPASLAPLVDGKGEVGVSLPQTPGSWVEIDLNRDWTLGELRLTAPENAAWNSFSIKVYQTGQSPDSAVDWSGEQDWHWSAQNRGIRMPGGVFSVGYHGPLMQIRYIRIVCIKPGDGTFAQISALSTKAAP